MRKHFFLRNIKQRNKAQEFMCPGFCLQLSTSRKIHDKYPISKPCDSLGKVALPKFGWQQSKAITFVTVNSTFQLIGLGWLVGFFLILNVMLKNTLGTGEQEASVPNIELFLI